MMRKLRRRMVLAKEWESLGSEDQKVSMMEEGGDIDGGVVEEPGEDGVVSGDIRGREGEWGWGG